MSEDSLDVALVTCRVKPEPDPDERPLLAALRKNGLDAEAWAWDDESLDWSRPRIAILRSTWNYPQAPERFRAWVDRTAEETELYNRPPVVHGNVHKGYLLDLERAGIRVAPTELVPCGADGAAAGNRTSVRDLAVRRGWSQVVVKPAISGSSFMTGRFDVSSEREAAAANRLLRQILTGQPAQGDPIPARDALVQRYLPSVEAEGERAIVFIDGELTHTIRKSPRFSGDDESVSDERLPTAEERTLAEAAIPTVGEPLLYGRVDVARDDEGTLRVMELELVEPSLFLVQWPAAMERLVGAVGRLVES